MNNKEILDLAIDKLQGQMRKLKTRMDRTNSRDSLGKAIAFENIESEKEDKEEKAGARGLGQRRLRHRRGQRQGKGLVRQAGNFGNRVPGGSSCC